MFLYSPGTIIQTICTLFFYLIVAGIIAGGAYIWIQGKRIDSLKQSLTTCIEQVDASKAAHTFMEDNLRILKRSCERKQKPTIVDGELKMENLFNGPDQ